jgi:hypothetical protein
MSGVKVVGTEQFREFAVKCRDAGSEGKGLLREIRKALKDGAEPVAEDARDNVRALSSSGGRGAGRAARSTFLLSKRRTPSDRVKAKLHASTGLRSSAARATKVTISTAGNSASAKIRVNASMMPADQRKLPAHMNRGRWRHPVLGHRDNWVSQTVNPPGWFDKAMDRGGPKVRKQAFDTVEDFLGRF